ncbi:oxygen-binding di-iron domain-containing protein [Bacillus norwichensis]|uniref:MBL fold metallo-hydrolase n=1 Tax=Bacillus norwichensis TaxID=2762217 RepID=A0ABR8VRU8_9BACI|nr:MBL fold metallo-hydrolase [Bacillus norwichensis]MBD8007504.1 MBL fold metallo-hydrolase [Bacillus norwichensis]
MARIDEIDSDVFRLSIFSTESGFQYNAFLVRDEEPLLYHTGPKSLFSQFSQAAASVIDLKQLRWISYSHFESDECGALNEWLTIAPQAEALVGIVGASVNGEFAIRPIRALQDNEVFSTGKKIFRYLRTPHLPHGWDAGMLFEETDRTLFTSDLFHQNGDVEPVAKTSLMARFKEVLQNSQSPFSNYIPYTLHTVELLRRLADLKPKTLAVMHGSSYKGDGKSVLEELIEVFQEMQLCLNQKD